MKILTVHRKLPIHIDDLVFEAKEGYKYIVPNHIATQFQNVPVVDLQPFINKKDVRGHVSYKNSRLFISRTGGIGDIFFIARVVQEIKKQYENVYTEFACSPRFSPAITSFLIPHVVDKYQNLIIPYPSYEKCDYFFTFEGFVEMNEDALTTNVYDLIAKDKFFIEIGNNHTVDLRLSSKWDEQAKELLDKVGNPPMIGMQMKASAILRTYPYPQQEKLIKMLKELGYKVLLLGRKDSIEEMLRVYKWDISNIIFPYTDEIKGSLELSAAFVKHCKALIAPDSAFVYIGDSFNIPTIGIYSPIASELRVAGLNVHAIETIDGCFNCGRHGVAPCPWSKDGWSPCLKAIEPEHILYLVKEIFNEKN